MICEVAEGRLTALDAVVALAAFPPEPGLTPAVWSTLEDRLALTLTSEMGAQRAQAHARTVIATICTPLIPNSSHELAHRIHAVFQEEALALAKLLGSFILGLSNAARLRPYREAVFLARDAIPLYVIAAGFARRGLQLPPLRLLDINRHMIPDFPERHPVSSKAAHRLRAYIGAEKPGEDPVALVDTGVYGTLIGAFEDIGAFPNAEVFFLFSKHPRHEGFLNRLCARSTDAGCGALGVIEAICDTIECWPKPYEASALSDGEHGPVAVSWAADAVSLLSSLSLYASLARWAAETPLDQLDATRTLDLRTRRITPLMLRDPLPEWRHAQAWLARAKGSPIGAG